MRSLEARNRQYADEARRTQSSLKGALEEITQLEGESMALRERVSELEGGGRRAAPASAGSRHVTPRRVAMPQSAIDGAPARAASLFFLFGAPYGSTRTSSKIDVELVLLYVRRRTSSAYRDRVLRRPV